MLAGHFPGRPIWPGVYQIEGMAQCAGLLITIDQAYKRGGPEAMRHLTAQSEVQGLLARTEASFTGVVEPPSVLDYELRLRSIESDVARVDARVSVKGRCVAAGSLVIVLNGRE